MAQGISRRLGAIGRASLGKDVTDVGSDRVEADDEVIGDLLVALTSGDEAEDLDFAHGEAVGMSRFRYW